MFQFSRSAEASRFCPPETLSAAALILEYLKIEGVDTVFGIPGGPISPLFDAMYREPAIKMISTRHESGAAFMAAGYARATGRIGVCFLTTGPGTTNALTAVAAAKADSLPLLIISAQVATITFGKGALQDSTYDRADVVEMYKSATKMSGMIANANNIGMTLRQAIRTAMTGRRGPVHLNIPTDLMRTRVKADIQWPQVYRPVSRVFDREAVKQAAEYLISAERPAILAGHGVNLSCAQTELLELAQLLSIPVATTPKGKGAFPESHPLALRIFGNASSPWAEQYLLSGKVDVLFVLGSSLHEISTQAWDERLKPTRAMLQQDVDPSIIARNYPVDVALVGDAKTTLRELLFHIRRMLAEGEHPLARKSAGFSEWKKSIPIVSDPHNLTAESSPIKPQRLMHELNQALPEDALIFIDSGNNTLWATHYLNATGKNLFIHNWGEFGSMGYGVAAAIGGKIGAPKRPVISIIGDGSFGMMGMEVATAVTYGIPVTWIVMNDARFNAVYHGQQLLYQGRTIGTQFHRVDIAKIAEGLGAAAYRVDRPGQIQSILEAMRHPAGPVVIDVLIDPDEVPSLESRVKSLQKVLAPA